MSALLSERIVINDSMRLIWCGFVVTSKLVKDLDNDLFRAPTRIFSWRDEVDILTSKTDASTKLPIAHALMHPIPHLGSAHLPAMMHQILPANTVPVLDPS